MSRGHRFVYVYAEPKDGDTDETPGIENGLFFVGKLLSDTDAIAELTPLFLGSVLDGRRVTRVEIGKPDEGAVIDTVHTLPTTPDTPSKDA